MGRRSNGTEGYGARHFALERVLKVTGTWNKTVFDPKSVNVEAMIFLVTVLFASWGIFVHVFYVVF